MVGTGPVEERAARRIAQAIWKRRRGGWLLGRRSGEYLELDVSERVVWKERGLHVLHRQGVQVNRDGEPGTHRRSGGEWSGSEWRGVWLVGRRNGRRLLVDVLGLHVRVDVGVRLEELMLAVDEVVGVREGEVRVRVVLLHLVVAQSLLLD